VLTGALTAGSLLIGLLVATTGFVRARAEAERSTRIADTLQGMLGSFDPAQAGSLDVDVESVKETARSVFGDDHATVAATLGALAVQLQNAGDFEAAEPLFREALGIWRQIYGDDHLNVGITLGRLGQLLQMRGKSQQAEAAMRDSLRIVDGLPGRPTLACHDTRLALAELLNNRGATAEAAELLEAELAELRASPTGRPFQVLTTLETLLTVLMPTPEDERTRAVYEEIYEVAHELYPKYSPLANASAMGFGSWLTKKGLLDEARPYLREAVEGYRRGDDPPRLYQLMALDGLFQGLRASEDPDEIAEADALLAEVIEVAGPIFAPAQHMENLVYLSMRLQERELYADAVPPLLQGPAIARESEQPRAVQAHLGNRLARLALATVTASDRTRDEYALARDAALGLLADEPGDDDFLTVLGAAHYRLGNLDEAEAVLSRLPWDDGAGREHAAPLDAAALALVHQARGDTDQARGWLERLRAALQEPEHRDDERKVALLDEVESLVTDDR
jgi:tetratricopeptide (TPR) repeat protein